MTAQYSQENRIVSGMRVTGKMHLGNYHGALKQWIALQEKYDCLFFVADWHALTTDYDNTDNISKNAILMTADWLAAGLDPKLCKIFIQSRVPEHAELHLLLSMITPLSWLERVPTYKDQQDKLSHKDLSTYGFLGYPLLQSADVMLYKATHVPVGEDQIPHIELIREVARRFNYIYGTSADFQEVAEKLIKSKLGKSSAKNFKRLFKEYQQNGDKSALEQGTSLIQAAGQLAKSEQEHLQSYLEGTGRTIIPEPQVLLTNTPKLPGLDGQKMSKSYNNTIQLGEEASVIEKKIKTMVTDPARVKRTDPGDPNKCPVWSFHNEYSDADTKSWVQDGCTTAKIGCIDCKMRVAEKIIAEQEPIRNRAIEIAKDRAFVTRVLTEGERSAKELARKTLQDVREVMGLNYSD